MMRLATLLALSTTLTLGGVSATRRSVARDAVAVARRFLPPRCRLAEDYLFDFQTGQISRRWPAVLAGHILSADSKDIVFAYYTLKGARYVDKTLFIGLLHRTTRGYVLVYTLSYRDRFLFSPQALLLVGLRGLPVQTLVVATAMGAALGATVQALTWRDPSGWQNLLPPNGSVGYFYLFRRPTGFYIALSLANHPGLNVSPAQEWFTWNGKRFVKTSNPKGSLEWKPLQ